MLPHVGHSPKKFITFPQILFFFSPFHSLRNREHAVGAYGRGVTSRLLMSMVRSSKFRHVFGKTVRPEDQYLNIQVLSLPHAWGHARALARSAWQLAPGTEGARLNPCSDAYSHTMCVCTHTRTHAGGGVVCRWFGVFWLTCLRTRGPWLGDPFPLESAMLRRRTPTFAMSTPSTFACRGAVVVALS